MSKVINLQEFLDWYKTVTIQYWKDQSILIREPRAKELINQKDIISVIQKNVLKGEWSDFEKIFNWEMTQHQQESILKEIFEGLGLVL